MKMAMMLRFKGPIWNVAGEGGGAATAADPAPAPAAAPAADPAAAPAGGSLLTGAPKDPSAPAGGVAPAAGGDADDKAGSGQGGGQQPDPADVVPEGDYTFELPEGMQPDTELLTNLTPVLKDLGLTQGQSQKLVSAYAEHVAKTSAASAEAWDATVTGWVGQAQADAEIGGEKFDATVADAQLALNKIGTPELRAFLDEYGGGNHPEVIRFMAKVGAMMKEDNPANAGGAAADTGDAASRMFPTSVRKA